MEEEFSVPGKPTTPEPPDYVNPLEASSRWYLTARAQAVRYAASLGFGIANRSQPAARAVRYHLDDASRGLT